jgi:hypothetical protein
VHQRDRGVMLLAPCSNYTFSRSAALFYALSSQ